MRPEKNGHGIEQQRSGHHLRCAMSLLPAIPQIFAETRTQAPVSFARWQRSRPCAIEISPSRWRENQRRHVCGNSARRSVSRFLRVSQDHVGEPAPLPSSAVLLCPGSISDWPTDLRLGSKKPPELWLLTRWRQSLWHRARPRWSWQLRRLATERINEFQKTQ